MTKLLIENEADVNGVDNKHESCLHKLLNKKYDPFGQKTFNLLLKYGICLNTKNKNEKTARMFGIIHNSNLANRILNINYNYIYCLYKTKLYPVIEPILYYL